ncbi:hypothetical protein [Clostridium sp.]|uniref:hypothetical protein n=1 Tax=Clostridium sp. TaxID=1506 RepID=UPI002626161D|nr:hypothetical protein [Clostridium sp.]
MRKYKNIPIFQYGQNENNGYITKEAVIKTKNTFINAPVMIYDENDKYNKNNPRIIGLIKEVTKIEFPFVYGDVILKDNLDLGRFRNYSIDVKESHEENGIIYFDEFVVQNISFELK